MSRPTVLLALAAALAALPVAGCGEGKRIPAVGPGYEIVILAPAGLGDLGVRVDRILSAPIVTVREEPTFQTSVDRLEDYGFYRTRKLVFAVSAPGEESMRKLLRRATGARERTRNAPARPRLNQASQNVVQVANKGKQDNLTSNFQIWPRNLIRFEKLKTLTDQYCGFDRC